MIEISRSEILETLGHGDHWIQEHRTDDKGGMCLHEAVSRSLRNPGLSSYVETLAELQGWGPSLNDADSTTFDLVASRLPDSITPKEQEQVYGPNYELTKEALIWLANNNALEIPGSSELAWNLHKNTPRPFSDTHFNALDAMYRLDLNLSLSLLGWSYLTCIYADASIEHQAPTMELWKKWT